MAAPNNPGPVTFVIGPGLRSNPNVHRAPMWPLESADRSRVGVVVAGKTLRNAKVRSAELLRVQTTVPCGTPLTAPQVTTGGLCRWKQLIRRAATSALTFMTFS